MTGRNDARATWKDGREGTGWRKSSRSSHTGSCCEASLNGTHGILLRDSLHPAGHVLRFRAGEWLALLSSLP
ncbi:MULTISPECIES: DUF397 domain-containing protein [unclassified Nocardiopsis]|nr:MULTISPECIES: DUF397 domain-containing protein [unclassified Nocardiopsis]